MIDELIEMIREAQSDAISIREVAALGSRIEQFQDSEVEQLLERIAELQDELPRDPLLHHVLQPVLAALVNRARRKNGIISAPVRGRITQLYKLSNPHSNLRNYLLAWLATRNQPDCIRTWTSLICNDPPEYRSGIGLAFGPLMRRDIEPQDWMLQSLLAEGVQHQQLAPAIFDLFNFYVREKIIELHPATERAEELTALLGQLVGKMGRIEEGSIDAQHDPHQIGQQVADSVALIVALSDTLAMIQFAPAIGKLHQALELKHRRVQAEAAAALVRLGDDMGKQALIKLAEEPVVRLRILKYAEELGLLNEISLELQGEIAQAESHLAIWLAEPAQMGIAPSRVELVDNRELYWPSYEHPVQCYIFRFEYGSENRLYRNLAISGPLVHAFSAGLEFPFRRRCVCLVRGLANGP